jgi:hypothetical protein
MHAEFRTIGYRGLSGDCAAVAQTNTRMRICDRRNL